MTPSIQTFNRQPKESAKAYQAALLYFEMGAKRSLEAVSQKLGKSKTICDRWSRTWNWVERARQWDADRQVKAQIAQDEALEEEAKKWAARQTEIREAGYSTFIALKAKAEEMLAFPLVKKTSKDGQTILHPAGWSFSTVNGMMETALKVGRLAAELSTENFDFDARKLSRKQLAAAREAILSGKSVAEAIRKAEAD